MRSAFAAFLRGFTLPFGVTSGRRIVLDGENGSITWYRADGTPFVIIGGPNATFDDTIFLPTGHADESFAPQVDSSSPGAGATENVQLRLLSGAMGAGTRSSEVICQSGSQDDASERASILLDGSAGLQLRIAGGANDPVGEATLAAGTVVVANDQVTASSRIFLSRRTLGGAPGWLSYVRNAGVGFTINSSNAADNGTVAYLIVDPLP